MQTTVESYPDKPIFRQPDGVRLAAEITKLSAYIYAATYRLLLLIREYDEKDYWHQPGLCSCAHWLNFQCGIGMNAAREKVRVAHALKDLPLISEGFRKGELSYSKVRAMTRIADATNEDYLMMIAKHGTAQRADALTQIAESYLNTTPTQSSTADRHQVVVHVSAETLKSDVTAETSTHINAEISHIEDGPHVTAETSRRIACDCSIYPIIEDENGDPLSVGRKTRSIPPALRRALRSRDQG